MDIKTSVKTNGANDANLINLDKNIQTIMCALIYSRKFYNTYLYWPFLIILNVMIQRVFNAEYWIDIYPELMLRTHTITHNA